MYNFRLTFRIKLGQIMTYLNTKKAISYPIAFFNFMKFNKLGH